MHGSWAFYNAIAVNNGAYISILVHSYYNTNIYHFIWSAGNYQGVTII